MTDWPLNRNQKAAFVRTDLTMTGPLKPLSELLSSGFSRLAKQAEAASELTERVRRCLGEPLGAHVLTASLRGEELVIRVDSAAWSAQVRYAGRRLMEALQQPGGQPIQRVRVRVGRPVAAPHIVLR
jgi:hypothetical protein